MGQENARIVIFFHGNAATRSVSVLIAGVSCVLPHPKPPSLPLWAIYRGQYNRVELSKALSSTLGAHVIIIDYRGFADSTGWPTEEGRKYKTDFGT